MKNKERKDINLFIVYSARDEDFYKELESKLEVLKARGQFFSWYERRIVGESWDKVVSERLKDTEIVLVLISPDFIGNEYCYDQEVLRVVDWHNKGRLTLLPILLKETNIDDTPFERIKPFPSAGIPVEHPEWENRNQAYEDIIEKLRVVLKQVIAPSHDYFLDEKEVVALPNSIKQFTIKNFQCIKDMHMDSIPVDAQWVFITGENAAGKTALLQALAIGLLGDKEKEANYLLQRSPYTRIEIEFKQDNENAISRFFNDSGDWKRETIGIRGKDRLKLFGYGVTRLNIQSKNVDERLKKRNPVYSLYNETEGNHRNIEQWLIENPNLTHKKEVLTILARLMPQVDNIEIVNGEVFYNEIGYKSNFLEISSGSKSIVAMVGDLLIRLFESQREVQKVSDFEGIVLIDELDMHMHLKWQRELPGFLSDIFPKIQFWATTHSFGPFMKAPGRSVFFTLTRTKNGTALKPFDAEIAVRNLLPNSMISSPLFGIEDFINPAADDFRPEQVFSDIKKNNRVLKDFEATARDFEFPHVLDGPDSEGE